MTTISDRVGVKQAVVEAIEDAFAATSGDPVDVSGVGVFFDGPGIEAPAEFVAIGNIDGADEAVVFGPAGSDDTYTIECVIDVTDFDTGENAAVRAQAILNVVGAALFQATAPPVRTEFGTVLYPGRLSGPKSHNPADGQPAGAVVELTIAAQCSKRGT